MLSQLFGACTEELGALTWDHVDLDGKPDGDLEVLPSIAVWLSVRAGGDTKTRKSRRTLALPTRYVEALRAHRVQQEAAWKAAGRRGVSTTLCSPPRWAPRSNRTNVRRAFRRVVKAADLDPKQWTAREMRHSFVSVLSDAGVSIEDIARLVGHSGTAVTEAVYRKQIRPVIEQAARAIHRIFPTAS